METVIDFNAMRANRATRFLNADIGENEGKIASIHRADTRGAVLRSVARIRERIEHIARTGLILDTLQRELEEYKAAVIAFEQLCPPAQSKSDDLFVQISRKESKGIEALQSGLASIERRVALAEGLLSEINRLERLGTAFRNRVISQSQLQDYEWEQPGVAYAGGSELVIAHCERLVRMAKAKLRDGALTEAEHCAFEASELIAAA